MRILPRLLGRLRVPYLVLSSVVLLTSVICSAAGSSLQNDFRQPIQTSQKLASWPLGFEQNLGQADPTIGFLARADGYFLYLGNGEFFIQFADHSNPGVSESVHVTLAGANLNVAPEGIDRLPGVTHYYIGSDPRAWITDVKRSRKVRYRYVYPGIDLIFYGDRRQLEFDFEAGPGADVSRIVLKVDGATVRKTGGDLELVTPRGNMAILKSPNLYQIRGGKRCPVWGGYSITNARNVAFVAADYDRALPLTIDPALVYSTLLQELMQSTIFAGQYPAGQNFEFDSTYSIAADSTGATYITGEAALPDPSQALQPQPTLYFSRAFVVKLDPTGSNLEYNAYLGSQASSSTSSSRGRAIAVDNLGNAYIAGDTLAPDFPVTPGTYSTAPVCAAGTGDSWSCDEPFAAKLDASGKLTYATFLVRGPASDSAGPLPLSVAVDSSGALYVAGTTTGPASAGVTPPLPLTPTLTTTAGAFQTARKNDSSAFVLKLHPDGSKVDYATYLGGSTSESLGGIAVDTSGITYVDGGTASSDFPTTPGAFQQTSSGKNAFFSKLSADGTSLLYSTFLGGTGVTAKATGIAIDGSNAAYLTGEVSGPGYPTTAGAFKTSVPLPVLINGDVWPYNFVSKFNTAGNLSYSTYVGYGMAGEETDRAEAIAVDSLGAAYVSGATVSSSYPAVGSIQPFPMDPSIPTGAVFVTKLNPAASALAYSTFVIDSVPRLVGIAVDSNHNAFLAGGNFTHVPTTALAFQSVAQGEGSTSGGFVLKIADSLGIGVAIPVPRQVTIPSIWQKGKTSPPFPVILGNYGDADISTAGISLSGENASDFAQTNKCGVTLPAGTNCTIEITFTPTVDVGARSAALSLVFGGSVPSQSVALFGQAGFPIIQITPGLSIDFGTIGVGTFNTVDMGISNVGTGMLNLGYSFSGDFTGDMFGGFLFILPPDASTPPLRVSFTPSVAGLRTGQLVITDDAAGSPHVVQFSGIGIAVNAGDFVLQTASNSSTSATITAGQAATYNLLAVGGAGFNDNVTLTCAGFPPGSTCTLNPNKFPLGFATFIGTSPQAVTVSVSTTARQSSMLNPAAVSRFGFAVFAGMLLFAYPKSARPRLRTSLQSRLLPLALTLAGLFVSCGGGQSSPPPTTGTPAGNYAITITATSSKLTHNMKLTLIVH